MKSKRLRRHSLRKRKLTRRNRKRGGVTNPFLKPSSFSFANTIDCSKMDVDVIKNIVCLMHHNTIPFLLVQFRLMTSVLFRYIAKSEIWIDTLRSKPTSYLKITSAKDLSNYLVSQPDNN